MYKTLLGCIVYDMSECHIYMQDDWRGFTVKVSDFGLSKLMPDSHMQYDDSLATDEVAGTVTHMAPELLSGCKMSSAADVYAFGVLSMLLLGCCDYPLLECHCFLAVLVEQFATKNHQIAWLHVNCMHTGSLS